MSKALDHSLDSILAKLGNFGKYQTYVLILVFIAVIFHSAVHNAFVFTAMDLEYRCKIPGCDYINSTYETSWISNAVPYQDNKPARCDMFVPNVNVTDHNNCSSTEFDRSRTMHCTSYVYSSEEVSIVKDYNLLCDENAWKRTLVGTINGIGQFFGLFISGVLSDRYGRKTVLIWGMVFCSICGIIRTFMPSYEWFLVFEFLDAGFGAGTYICGFIIAVEFVGPKHRVLSGTGISSCYAIGEILTASVAWATKSWKPTIYFLYGPCILLISYHWLIPESIRWSLSKGRTEEALATIKKAAKVNGKTIPDTALEKLSLVSHDEPDNEEKGQLRQVASSRILLLRLINCAFCWMTCAFLFYGLTLNSVALAGNAYLDFILTALVEIPAYFACIYAVEKFGRKKSLCASYILTGIACLGFIFIPEDCETAKLSVYLLGKFGATAAFTVIYVLTSEIFPTKLRQSLMGACSTCGRIGSMIAPQTPLLAQVWTPMPMIMFFSLSTISGCLAFLFPETLNIKLPDTIQEAENIGTNSSEKNPS